MTYVWLCRRSPTAHGPATTAGATAAATAGGGPAAGSGHDASHPRGFTDANADAGVACGFSGPPCPLPATTAHFALTTASASPPGVARINIPAHFGIKIPAAGTMSSLSDPLAESKFCIEARCALSCTSAIDRVFRLSCPMAVASAGGTDCSELLSLLRRLGQPEADR